MSHLENPTDSSSMLVEELIRGLLILGQDKAMAKKVGTTFATLRKAANVVDKVNAQTGNPTRFGKELADLKKEMERREMDKKLDVIGVGNIDLSGQVLGFVSMDGHFTHFCIKGEITCEEMQRLRRVLDDRGADYCIFDRQTETCLHKGFDYETYEYEHAGSTIVGIITYPGRCESWSIEGV